MNDEQLIKVLAGHADQKCQEKGWRHRYCGMCSICGGPRLDCKPMGGGGSRCLKAHLVSHQNIKIG